MVMLFGCVIIKGYIFKLFHDWTLICVGLRGTSSLEDDDALGITVVIKNTDPSSPCFKRRRLKDKECMVNYFDVSFDS